MIGTYSPEDNKLRLYAEDRLPADLYKRVKENGFVWAAAQGLFVAPMWTPAREDLLLELCEQITDEDTSLADRAEQRANRFNDYSSNRKEDAAAAHAAVSSLCESIPLGQPILVGHHSEKRARKDAERIENGMRRAVKMWETAEYWRDRAANAVSAAKYKERPDVRARRIKKLEAEKRKVERNQAEDRRGLRFWEGKFVVTNKETGEKRPFEISEANKARICKVLGCDADLSRLGVVKNDHGSMWGAWDVLLPDGERYAACPSKSVAEVQAVALERYPKHIAYWQRWIDHYSNRLTYERAMLESEGGTATDRKAPQVGGACHCWASPGRFDGGRSYIQKVNKVSVTVLDNWGNGGPNFSRTIPFDKLSAIMSPEEVQAARDCGTLVEIEKRGFVLRGNGNDREAARATEDSKPSNNEGQPFAAMKEALKVGVKTIVAPCLFPTPLHLAERMVEEACIEEGHTILEPSAGTGNILQAIKAAGFNGSVHVDAVEINRDLCRMLEAKGFEVYCGDFLQVQKPFCPDAATGWDRILMNPPFDHGSDIEHIKHAFELLNMGGILVAICAAGPKQREAFEEMGADWNDLPAGSFSNEGTNVNTAMIVLNKF